MTSTITAVLDANVSFPFTLRDALLRVCAAGFFQARWSTQILDEVERNLVLTGKTTAAQAARLRSVMDQAFPEATVVGYERYLAKATNQAKDRHIVAAALKARTQVGVTHNLKDFVPMPDGIVAMSPGGFLLRLVATNLDGMRTVLREQAADLTRPPTTFHELLVRLERIVPAFVAAVRRS